MQKDQFLARTGEQMDRQEEKTQIITNPSGRELKEHGSYRFPFLVSRERLSRYETGSFLWHWHTEIEFTLVTDGCMIYQINDSSISLNEGDALFGNSGTLHSAHRADEGDCRYISITFSPRLLYGYEGSLLQEKYVEPLIHNSGLAFLHFHGKDFFHGKENYYGKESFNSEESWHGEVIEGLRRITAVYEEKKPLYELRLQEELLHIWRLMLEHCSLDKACNSNGRDEKNYERIRGMISFIQENYQQKLELEDIARHVHLCKSECCRIFKRYMKESLFDYLLKYRIEQSLPDILAGEESLTEIALHSGFADSNYFSKVFHRLKGCSPRDYRKKIYHFKSDPEKSDPEKEIPWTTI